MKRLFLVLLTAAVFAGCGNRDVSEILKHHSPDLRFNFAQQDYYLPFDTYKNVFNAVRAASLGIEFPNVDTEGLSGKKILSQILNVYTMGFLSDSLSIVFQFPDLNIYNEYYNKFRENPFISRDDFKHILRYEYDAELIKENKSWLSANFNRLNELFVHNGKEYIRLTTSDSRYFLSEEFISDMELLKSYFAPYSTW